APDTGQPARRVRPGRGAPGERLAESPTTPGPGRGPPVQDPAGVQGGALIQQKAPKATPPRGQRPRRLAAGSRRDASHP
ncbi:unnamed protein product, partial [Heterosigma akashiwo]